MKEKKEYQATYGLLRIIACFSVIYHHLISGNQNYINTLDHSWIITLIDNLLMCNNGLFFMISGKFALENYDGNMLKYYKNKSMKILLPFLFVSLYFYYFYNDTVGKDISIQGFIRAFMGNEIMGYLWFLYTIIGFYVVAPFFARMVQAMNRKEKRIFFFLLIFIIFLRNYCEIKGIPFIFADFPLVQSAFIFLGYLIDNMEIHDKEEKILYIFAIIATIVSCYEAIRFPGWNSDLNDNCLSRIFMCLGIFLFVTRRMDKCAGILKRPIKYMASETYYIYLIHVIAQGIFLGYLWHLWVQFLKLPFTIALFAGSTVVFLISLALSRVCHILLKVPSFIFKGKWVDA